jgi:TetR/AcrR family transcriptional regulator, lmrAB and yxaGH operons repressor
MPRRSDARQRMVQAAKQLIRERGYNATAFSDVLELSGAPRGSVYHHFPHGKPQLAMEAAEAHAQEQVELLDALAEQAETPGQLIEAYLGRGRESMVASGYGRGCGIAPLVTEGAAEEIPEIAETGRHAFSVMIDALASHFVVLGAERAAAHTLAEAVVTGAEGVMIVSRALRSPAPYDAMLAALLGQADALAPASSGRA